MGGAPLDWETFTREHVERRPTEQSLLYHVDLGECLRLLLIAAAYDAEAVLHARCELVEQSVPKADLYQLHRAHKRAIRQRLAPLQCVCRACGHNADARRRSARTARAPTAIQL